jgi:hypothetical protein
MNIFVIAATILALLHAVDGAKPTNKYMVKGNGAYGQGDAYSDNGCTYTSIAVGANEQTTKDGPGKPTIFNNAWFYVYGYNWCNGENLSGYTEIPAANFAGNVNSGATLFLNGGLVDITTCGYNNETYAYDCFSETVPISLNAVWTPTGVTQQGHSNWRYSSPSYSYNTRSNGAYSDADLTLTAEINGEEFVADNTYGQVYKSNSGTITWSSN